MASVEIRELLEAGVHLGHQTNRWNPKMDPYIFGARNGVYVLDLQKTVRLFRRAADFLEGVAARGGHVLFVGTKRQAKDTIEEEARRCGQFHVTQRWLGGTLTNWRTIHRSIRHLQRLQEMGDNQDQYAGMTKKERLRLEKKRVRMEKVLQGIRDMEALPDAVVIVDPNKEKIAVAEANKLNIPVVAIVDTNCDPDPIQYVIPGNDDAIRSIRLFASRLADAVLEGNGARKAVEDEKARTAPPSGPRPRMDRPKMEVPVTEPPKAAPDPAPAVEGKVRAEESGAGDEAGGSPGESAG